MNGDQDQLWALITRFAGAAGGTIVSLAFVPPKSVVECLRRGSASLVMGAAFQPYLLPFLSQYGVIENPNGVFVSALLAALATWTVLGRLLRAFESWEVRRVKASADPIDPPKP